MSKKVRVRFIHIDCHSVYKICDLYFKVQWQVIHHGRWDEMFVYTFVSLVNLLDLIHEA